MAKWHYQLGTVKHGPVNSKRLKELVHLGELSPEDLVWREGLEKWVKAKKIKDLFPHASAEQSVPFQKQVPTKNNFPSSSLDERIEAVEHTKEFKPDAESPSSDSVEALKDTGEKLGESAKSFGSAVGSAAKASLMQAEITKIKSISLPNAYRKLGEAIHQNDSIKTAWPQLVTQIDEIHAKVSELLTEKANRSEPKVFADRVKAVANSAKTKGQTLLLDQQLKKRFVELGTVAYENLRDNAGPSELVQPVRDLLEKLKSQNDDLSHQKSDMLEKGGMAFSGLSDASKKRPKTFIALGCGFLLISMCIVGAIAISANNVASQHVSQSFAEANELWEAGNKAKAVAIYERLSKGYLGLLGGSDQSLLLERSINYYAENNQALKAQELIAIAEKNKDAVDLNSSPAKNLLAEYRREQEAKQAEKLKQEQVAEESKQAEKAKQAAIAESRHSTESRDDAPISNEYKVSKGLFKGKITVENRVPLEIEISSLSFGSKWQLNFTVFWHSSLGGRVKDPWHWSAYDKDGVKLDGGAVIIPHEIEMRTKFKCHITLDSNDFDYSDLVRIVIHE